MQTGGRTLRYFAGTDCCTKRLDGSVGHPHRAGSHRRQTFTARKRHNDVVSSGSGGTDCSRRRRVVVVVPCDGRGLKFLKFAVALGDDGGGDGGGGGGGGGTGGGGNGGVGRGGQKHMTFVEQRGSIEHWNL